MDKDPDPHERATRHFIPDAAVGWSFAIATLERLSSWSVQALRLGTLHLLQQNIRAMAQPGGDKKALLLHAKELLAALDHLPWNETTPSPPPPPPSGSGHPSPNVSRATTSPPRGLDR